MNSFAQGSSEKNGSNINDKGGLSAGMQPGGALNSGGPESLQKPQGVNNTKKGDKRHYNGSSHLSEQNPSTAGKITQQ